MPNKSLWRFAEGVFEDYLAVYKTSPNRFLTLGSYLKYDKRIQMRMKGAQQFVHLEKDMPIKIILYKSLKIKHNPYWIG